MPKDTKQNQANKTPKNAAPNAPKNVQTTGHEWDGIEEYNNPLPLWWLWIFLASVIFSVGYVIYYPAIPPLGQAFVSVSGWTQYKALEDEVGVGMLKREPYEQRLQGKNINQIKQDPDLYAYATSAGKSVYGLHCATCHGAEAGGSKGYPNHLDDEWIWGGSLDEIIYTIRHGIRDVNDPETLDMGPMMAFGRDELLDKDQMKDVIYYVHTLSKPHLKKNDVYGRGMEVFANNCVSCHGENAEGIRELGAPALNNAIWLYGGSTNDMMETLQNGRAGMMPAFGSVLSESDILKLALYIHSLGGGE